jgi:hypothetical protein
LAKKPGENFGNILERGVRERGVGSGKGRGKRGEGRGEREEGRGKRGEGWGCKCRFGIGDCRFQIGRGAALAVVRCAKREAPRKFGVLTHQP